MADRITSSGDGSSGGINAGRLTVSRFPADKIKLEPAPCTGAVGVADTADRLGGTVSTQDLYASHGDEIADALLADPALFDPVERDFADASDSGYGEWSTVDPDDDEPGDDATAGPGADRYNRALSDQEQADLDELGRMMASTDQPLLTASGRGAYVHPGADDDGDSDGAETHEADPGPAATAGPALPPEVVATGAKRRVDLSRRSHRLAAIGAAGSAVALVALLTMGGNNDTGSNTASSSSNPNFSVPTVTQTPAAPTTTAAAGTDGPIGIKRADSRCTAGSTDPKQAFDVNLETAWMCVPAYGVPGTVLRVEFDNWYVVTGMSIVPGWNRVNPDGSDEWVKHKTAATVEYQFNDPDETRLTQKTNSLRDEVFTAVQPPVLASAMTITITEFGSPTGAVADVTNSPGQGGIIASNTPVTGDLKDFAVSSISIIGHRAN